MDRKMWQEWLIENMAKARKTGTDLYSLDYRHEELHVEIDEDKLNQLIEIDLDLHEKLKKLDESGKLRLEQFEALEQETSEQHPGGEEYWQIINALADENLLDRPELKEEINRIGKLNPGGIPYGSASWLLVIRFQISSCLYAVARFTDRLEEDEIYLSCLWYFLRSVLACGWETGNEAAEKQMDTRE